MFKKVHIRLTLLCTGITAIIMIVMSFVYLYVSEKGLYRNQYDSFKNDMNTIATNLEQQPVISMEWLSKMEAKGNYSFFLIDNGVPFLYNKLNGLNLSSESEALLAECLTAYSQNYFTASSNDSSLSPYVSFQTEFEFTSVSDRKKYYASVMIFQKNSSKLQVIVLSSLSMLEQQILRQRMIFILIDLFAVILLAVFSWFFTGRLLAPIIKSQHKQNEFIAAASHELRTPLAVILSSVECCRDADQDSLPGFLSTIYREGLRMRSLISDMLTLSGSDSHKLSIRCAATELDTLLINSFEAFEPLARKQKLTLSINLPEGALPSCTCDEERISQVLSILLHNAISYTPEGGRIVLSLACRKEHFYLSVSDSGPGISDEDKKRIFDRFYRGEKARTTKGHFGLGLSIACEIVNAHRGKITVCDSPMGGALFTVELPAV